MSNYQQRQFEPLPTNHTGTVGFAMSLLSYLTCGLLAVPAAFVCILGLLGEEQKPRTLPIIGLVLSLPSLLIGIPVLLFIAGMLGAASTVATNRAINELDYVESPKPPREIRINAGEGEVIYTEPAGPEVDNPKYGSKPGSRFPVVLE